MSVVFHANNHRCRSRYSLTGMSEYKEYKRNTKFDFVFIIHTIHTLKASRLVYGSLRNIDFTFCLLKFPAF